MKLYQTKRANAMMIKEIARRSKIYGSTERVGTKNRLRQNLLINFSYLYFVVIFVVFLR